ncbi:MAG TPA: penicillin-binding transpeptidase domain-containing protein [Xanthomonadales bacterium]|nr:penicillin-binding transpeptidase domain-containing protein [Xanthomonadales bacterium]
MKWLSMLLAVLSLVAVGAMPAPAWHDHPDFARLLADAGARGTIVVLDEQAKRWHVADRARAQRGFLPASTFKVFNALVALDAGSVADEHEVIAWDGVEREFDSWNRDHDLASGMKASAVWFYQEIARRSGESRMRSSLERAGYGNGDLRAGIDRFWLEGGFRVTPVEQITLLQRLADDALPFTPRSQAIVRRVIEVDRGDGFVLRGKTGMLRPGTDGAIGWFVGWVERGERRWFVAVNIDLPDGALAPKRVALARDALAAVGAL